MPPRPHPHPGEKVNSYLPEFPYNQSVDTAFCHNTLNLYSTYFVMLQKNFWLKYFIMNLKVNRKYKQRAS